jgi:hypothetical protein
VKPVRKLIAWIGRVCPWWRGELAGIGGCSAGVWILLLLYWAAAREDTLLIGRYPDPLLPCFLLACGAGVLIWKIADLVRLIRLLRRWKQERAEFDRKLHEILTKQHPDTL